MNRADRARRRPRQRGAYRKMPRARDRHQAAAGLIDAERRFRRGLATPLEVGEIAVHDGLQIGVEHGGGEPLVFAEFRLHLRRDDRYMSGWRRSASRIFVSCAGLRNENRRQTAQASAPRRRCLHQRGQRCGSSAWISAIRGDAFRRLEAQLARNQRRRMVRLQARNMRADLPSDLDQIAEAFGGDQRDLAAPPLDQRIGGDRRAVREPRDGGGSMPRRAPSSRKPAMMASAGLAGVEGTLCRTMRSRVVEREKIRKGAADVDTYHPGHLSYPVARSDLAGSVTQDQSMLGCRIGALREDLFARQ